MNKKIEKIRKEAMVIREKLSYANAEQYKAISKMDKIIRGTVLVKWMHIFAVVFFIVFAGLFLCLMYPEVQFMLVILGFAIGGYAVSFIGIVVQMKMFNHTIEKVRSTL